MLQEIGVYSLQMAQLIPRDRIILAEGAGCHCFPLQAL